MQTSKAEVSVKSEKYSSIGARELVPYEYGTDFVGSG